MVPAWASASAGFGYPIQRPKIATFSRFTADQSGQYRRPRRAAQLLLAISLQSSLSLSLSLSLSPMGSPPSRARPVMTVFPHSAMHSQKLVCVRRVPHNPGFVSVECQANNGAAQRRCRRPRSGISVMGRGRSWRINQVSFGEEPPHARAALPFSAPLGTPRARNVKKKDSILKTAECVVGDSQGCRFSCC